MHGPWSRIGVSLAASRQTLASMARYWGLSPRTPDFDHSLYVDDVWRSHLLGKMRNSVDATVETASGGIPRTLRNER